MEGAYEKIDFRCPAGTSSINYLLRNPFYAGAYVWGRRPVATVLAEGRLEKRQGAMRRAEDCRVFIPDHHVGYTAAPPLAGEARTARFQPRSAAKKPTRTSISLARQPRPTLPIRA